MSQEPHETTKKYFPATAKDHEREMKVHDYDDRVVEGINTASHTSRYVPAPGRGPFFGLFGKKKTEQQQHHHHDEVKSRGQTMENQKEDVGE